MMTHRSRSSAAQPHRIASFSPSLPQLQQRPLLSLYRSACGHRTETSIQNCCRTHGKQDTTSIIAHLSTGSASGCGFNQIVQLRDMSFPVCVSSSLGDPSAQCTQDSTVRPGPGTSVFAPQRVTRVPLLWVVARSTLAALAQGARGARSHVR